MTPDLSRRLARALDIGAATPEQRERVIAAAQQARTFDQLPEPIRRLVERLEAD
ncbi:hypothetical protein EDC02_5932 [Micromonospora sp. Llam0]|uniref:hypothetical protein n=1 Tax=Micromonospora sp. Llam0 TaxID=2485143 RepID=UPI000FB34F9F|nr:hypothetical protein [Micromonospora sp. Llam0]ROO51068.1 hypothetical protein EDC02_5932 [Micromonospora sp. Llam0]